MKKILITGSSGLLGRELVRQLKKRGYKPLGIDLLPAPTTRQIVDIQDKDALASCLAGCQGIIHTAALHGRHTALGYLRRPFIEANVLGTLNLLELAVVQGVEKFIYTSTTSIYGAAMYHPEQAVWVDEALTPIPRDIYDITKQAAENLCLDFSRKEGLRGAILRISRFMEEPPNVLANHRLYRGLDVEDGAMGHILALEAELEGFETFNLAAAKPFRREDLADLRQDPQKAILRYFPQAAQQYASLGWQFPNSIDRVYVIEKAERLIGYRPKGSRNNKLLRIDEVILCANKAKNVGIVELRRGFLTPLACKRTRLNG